ncbi:MBL fold metallo-hydrolase [Streptomyces sp. NPDC006739]|uniref:MBL fold metallo-hydrolase n=1 Tax=Streptomyces sp. NPDC006739 TaxID=3364763 RepID=UPI0036B3BA87
MADALEGRLVTVVDGVHAWIQEDGTWWINNAGAVTGDEGTILVDTCATAERTTAFLSAVEKASGGAPIRAAVNTHLHGDHTHGNALLPETTLIVGHEETRRGILADTLLTATPPVWAPTPVWGIREHRAPTVVPDGDLTLHTGDRRVVVRHPGHPAHTAGDLVAWLPEERVLFTGDLVFHQVTPMILMGSLEGALRSLDWMADFGAEHLVPGHGPLVTGDLIDGVLDAHARYYRLVEDTARHGRREGLSPLEAARTCDLGEFAAWPDAERIVLNLHRAYADADGKEPDLVAALTDAVTFNGGPLRCGA